MEYHIRKLTEYTTLYEEYYKVEAESLKEATKQVVENRLDPYYSRTIPDVIEFLDWEEVQLVMGKTIPVINNYTDTQLLFSSVGGHILDEELTNLDEDYKQIKDEQGLLQDTNTGQ